MFRHAGHSLDFARVRKSSRKKACQRVLPVSTACPQSERHPSATHPVQHHAGNSLDFAGVWKSSCKNACPRLYSPLISKLSKPMGHIELQQEAEPSRAYCRHACPYALQCVGVCSICRDIYIYLYTCSTYIQPCMRVHVLLYMNIFIPKYITLLT